MKKIPADSLNSTFNRIQKTWPTAAIHARSRVPTKERQKCHVRCRYARLRNYRVYLSRLFVYTPSRIYACTNLFKYLNAFGFTRVKYLDGTARICPPIFRVGSLSGFRLFHLCVCVCVCVCVNLMCRRIFAFRPFARLRKFEFCLRHFCFQVKCVKKKKKILKVKKRWKRTVISGVFFTEILFIGCFIFECSW